MSWLDKFIDVGYASVQASGVNIPQQPTLNFIGFTITDDPANNRTNITGGVASDLNLTGQTQGAIAYFNGSHWVVLPPGTALQVLTIVSGVPAWTTV